MPKLAPQLSHNTVRSFAKGTDATIAGQTRLRAVGGCPGLSLRVVGGSRSWVLRIMVAGARRNAGLGGFPEVSLEEARDRGRELRRLARQGIDPLAQKQAAKVAGAAAAAKNKTFRECAEIVIAQKRVELSNPKAADQWQSTIETYAYPLLGNQPIAELTKQDIAAVLEPIWRSIHETATRVRGRIEAIFDYAKAIDCFKGENPATWKILKPLLGKFRPDEEHHPALPYSRIGAFMPDLRKREGIAPRALEFTILTATRSNEVRGAKRSEINLVNKRWTIPAGRMKGRREHVIPLSDDAVKLIKALPIIKGSDWLFTAPRGGKFSDAALAAVIKRMHNSELRAGREGWLDPKLNRIATPHGMRSAFRDWAGEESEHEREVNEQALAHKLKDKSEAAYQRGQYLKKRAQLMNDWAKYCRTKPKKKVGDVANFEKHNRKHKAGK